jgi:hypothetical protein
LKFIELLIYLCSPLLLWRLDEVVKTEDETYIIYGFARYLRDALPNASFVGFTGTPIESMDKSSPTC